MYNIRNESQVNVFINVLKIKKDAKIDKYVNYYSFLEVPSSLERTRGSRRPSKIGTEKDDKGVADVVLMYFILWITYSLIQVYTEKLS